MNFGTNLSELWKSACLSGWSICQKCLQKVISRKKYLSKFRLPKVNSQDYHSDEFVRPVEKKVQASLIPQPSVGQAHGQSRSTQKIEMKYKLHFKKNFTKCVSNGWNRYKSKTLKKSCCQTSFWKLVTSTEIFILILFYSLDVSWSWVSCPNVSLWFSWTFLPCWQKDHSSCSHYFHAWDTEQEKVFTACITLSGRQRFFQKSYSCNPRPPVAVKEAERVKEAFPGSLTKAGEGENAGNDWQVGSPTIIFRCN